MEQKKNYVSKAAATTLFYLLFLTAIPIAEHFSRSGPCVPGGGVLLAMCFIPVSLIYFCIHLYRYPKNRIYGKCLLVHVAAWIIFITLSITNII
jgi:hypothetical protein